MDQRALHRAMTAGDLTVSCILVASIPRGDGPELRHLEVTDVAYDHPDDAIEKRRGMQLRPGTMLNVSYRDRSTGERGTLRLGEYSPVTVTGISI